MGRAGGWAATGGAGDPEAKRRVHKVSSLRTPTAGSICFLQDLGGLSSGESHRSRLDPLGPFQCRISFPHPTLGGFPTGLRSSSTQPREAGKEEASFTVGATPKASSGKDLGDWQKFSTQPGRLSLSHQNLKKPKATNESGKHSELFESREQVNMDDKHALIAPTG